MTKDEAISILNLGKNPSPEEVQKSYRTLAAKYHPDRHQSENNVVREVMGEKFNNITQAKDFLLSNSLTTVYADAVDFESHYGTWRWNPKASKYIEDAEKFRDRRQFSLATLECDKAMKECPADCELFELKARILSDEGHLEAAFNLMWDVGKKLPSRLEDIEFLSEYSVFASQAQNHQEAIRAINKLLSISGDDVPIYLQQKAAILIEAGRAKEADQVIDRLKIIDPTNPIIELRNQYVNVNDTYVGKKDAAAAGCFLCALLECIFDCC